MLKTLGPASNSGFTFQTADRLDVDARATVYVMAFAPPQKLGEASFYIVSAHDHADKPLDGGGDYTLRIPTNVPAQQFWAVTTRGPAPPGDDTMRMTNTARLTTLGTAAALLFGLQIPLLAQPS